MPQSERVSQFMCYWVPRKSARKQRITTTLSLPYPTTTSNPTITIADCIYTVVNDDEVYVRKEIIRLFNFQYSLSRIVKIVTVGVSPIDTMHYRFAL